MHATPAVRDNPHTRQAHLLYTLTRGILITSWLGILAVASLQNNAAPAIGYLAAAFQSRLVVRGWLSIINGCLLEGRMDHLGAALNVWDKALYESGPIFWRDFL